MGSCLGVASPQYDSHPSQTTAKINVGNNTWLTMIDPEIKRLTDKARRRELKAMGERLIEQDRKLKEPAKKLDQRVEKAHRHEAELTLCTPSVRPAILVNLTMLVQKPSIVTE